MGPEVFDNEVSPRSDIWALGIVIFEILSGQRPFRGDNPMAIYAQVRRCDIKYDTLLNSGCSDLAVAFVKRCLAKEESSRPSASVAIKDDWFSDALQMPPLPQGRQAKKIRKSLENYSTRSHFTKAAMNCIAAQLDTSRIEGLTGIFQSMDVDNNGLLSPAEVAAGMAELGVDADAIGAVIDALDVNCDGHVAYSEFVASLLQTQGELVEDVLYHAFHVFDVNGDGVISLDELRSMLSGNGPLAVVLPDGKTVDEVLQEVDTSKDNVISFAEFKGYLMREQQGGTPPAVSRRGSRDLAGEVMLLLEGEDIFEAFRRLAPAMGRSESELVEQARRLKETHWMNHVGELRGLNDDEWRRLNLPLKLEKTLRSHIVV
jgi:Ca2+-binding EF-hand superfamily protein